ncbi:MAG TPA: hypothetical protein VF137_07170 [Candidatus Dormibacteraeota bacterium]
MSRYRFSAPWSHRSQSSWRQPSPSSPKPVDRAAEAGFELVPIGASAFELVAQPGVFALQARQRRVGTAPELTRLLRLELEALELDLQAADLGEQALDVVAVSAQEAFSSSGL